MNEIPYSKEKALESIKNAVLQMPNSLRILYDKFSQQEKEIYLHLILYGNTSRVSVELGIEIKDIKKVESKAKDYLIRNSLSLMQDIKKLEENLFSKANKLNIELSDIIEH